jgi:deoxycytidylate deaminase
MINYRDEKYMAFTRRMAIQNSNSQNRAKLAASLVIRNEIISIGYNSYKSHPLQKRFSKNIEAIFKHAEVDCIINALRCVSTEDLEKATLYVYRIKRLTKESTFWSDGYSEPCCGCKQAINHFKIKKVVYSTEEDDKYIELETK